MSAKDDFRARASEVRRQARARLAELRAARRASARRGPAPAAAPTTVKSEPQPNPPEAPEAGPGDDDVVVSIGLGSSLGGIEASDVARAFVEELGGADTPDESPAQAASEAHVAVSPSADEAAPPSEAAADRVAERLQDSAREAASAGVAAGESELADLPGIGPGLIWLLKEAGIETLEQLAGVDAATLRQRIGFVGLLINVDAWIAFAAERVGASRAAS